ncbi:hypothetical protein LTR85_009912 [Meristemomyces frigidus]|nr:hypothetical protein LTR85_009912 [Meristemomyces frigidus]
MADVRRRHTPDDGSKSHSEKPVQARPHTTSTGLPITSLLTIASVGAAGWLWYSGAFMSDSSSTVAQGHAPATNPSSSTPVQASSVGHTDLTDAELRAYDGSDPEKPLYIAIDGRIFDVSSGRGFYGPGGHYGHFAGRDATRAWVTECWDEEEQLTHDMRDVEDMFMPTYMDEQLTDAANGKSDQPAALVEQAKQVMKRIGKVTMKERKRRREEDTPKALEKVDEALAHWVNFFAGSEKYAEVGKVVRDDAWEEAAPPPPAICEQAKKKKPIQGGGKLDAIMNAPMDMGGELSKKFGGGGGGGSAGAERSGEMPDFVKQKLAAKGLKS